MDGSSDNIKEQARAYIEAVGRGIPAALIAEIAEFATDATPTTFFKKHSDVRFWYEKLEKNGWEEKVGSVADLWAQDDDNVRRAAKQVGRPPKPPHRQLVRAFGIYQFKKVLTTEWRPLSEGPGKDHRAQTVVCIALEHLSPDNGCPFDLQTGMDVCMDGEDQIWLPPSGGGKCILIWLDL